MKRNAKAFRQMWRIIEGAARDTFETHPDYLTRSGQRFAVDSLTKRITGELLGYAAQAARGRSDGTSKPSAADQGSAECTSALSRGLPLRRPTAEASGGEPPLAAGSAA